MERQYKESGIEWIGRIPKEWETCQLKRLLSFRNGQDYKLVESETGYPVYGSGGIFVHASEYLYDGEAVLFGRKGTIDRPIYVNEKFWTVDTMYYAIPLSTGDGKFVYYLGTLLPFNKYQTSTALPSMTQTILGDMKVILPPLSEQQRIASYLDKKCGEIDELIALQEKMIVQLTEYKQAVITEAVTKGLDPNAKLVPSGIEWIGEVPEGWKKTRIKSVIKLLTDYDANGSFADISKNCKINTGEPYAWMVRATDLENKRYGIIEGNNYCDFETYKYLSKSSLHENDILIAKRGDIGKSYLVPKCDSPMTLAPNTYLLLTKIDLIYNRYFFYYLQSRGGIENLKILNKSTTLGALYKDDVKAMHIPLPPLPEQHSIASYLDTKCSEIDSLIALKRQKIESLNAYKKSVIYEAVTGKTTIE